jgi:RNA polymerase sigma-70 factor (ECF subfamily)
MPGNTTVHVQLCLDRLKGGDAAARDDLIRAAADRMLLLTRQMLRRYSTVARWEQTDDVCQNALVRMCRALEQVVPPTPLDFFKFASAQVRRELIDLARHYYGPQGRGRNHASVGPGEDGKGGPLTNAPGAEQDDPARLALWTEFHTHADTLPEEEKAVFDLIWYQGMPQEEAAEVLGVSVRTVKTRWRNARLALHEKLGGELPDA